LYTAAKIAAGKAAITSKSTRLSTKLDMPPDFGISYIKRLCIAMLKKVRSLRKFSCGRWLAKPVICSCQDAKSGSLIFFAAFALRYSEFWMRLNPR
jgi:hypothetical protein